MGAKIVSRLEVEDYVNNKDYHILKVALCLAGEENRVEDGAVPIAGVDIPYFYVVAKSKVEIQNEMSRQIDSLFLTLDSGN